MHSLPLIDRSIGSSNCCSTHTLMDLGWIPGTGRPWWWHHLAKSPQRWWGDFCSYRPGTPTNHLLGRELNLNLKEKTLRSYKIMIIKIVHACMCTYECGGQRQLTRTGSFLLTGEWTQVRALGLWSFISPQIIFLNRMQKIKYINIINFALLECKNIINYQIMC